MYTNPVLTIISLTGIPWQKQSFREHFQNFEYFKIFHEMLSRATACPTERVARVVQAALVKQLKAWGETEPAIWFERYWCVARGTWTIGNPEVGGVAHNNGVEALAGLQG